MSVTLTVTWLSLTKARARRPPARSRRLAPPRHLAGLRARLGHRWARCADTQHPHRLESEAQPLAAIGRADVEAGQLAHALEPVADRVPVGEELLARRRHRAVAGEECLE